MQDTKLIKLYWSDLFNILIVPQFIVNQPSDKRISLHKKWNFPLRIFLANVTKSAGITFTEEIFNEKPHFLCSVLHISNIWFVLDPKLIQRHYKLSKIEMNGVIGIIFFFCKIIFLQLIVEEKILKHQLGLGGNVSPN